MGASAPRSLRRFKVIGVKKHKKPHKKHLEISAYPLQSSGVLTPGRPAKLPRRNRVKGVIGCTGISTPPLLDAIGGESGVWLQARPPKRDGREGNFKMLHKLLSRKEADYDLVRI